MSPRPGTNVARFVRTARALLAFQLMAAAGAAALAFWAVIEVRDLVEERDALVARVAVMEAARRVQPGEAPALASEEPKAAVPPPVSSVPQRVKAAVKAAPATRPDSARPRDEVTPDERPRERRPPDENLLEPVGRPREPKPQDPAPKAATERR